MGALLAGGTHIGTDGQEHLSAMSPERQEPENLLLRRQLGRAGHVHTQRSTP